MNDIEVGEVSDTPRTDAFIAETMGVGISDFTRQLERELNALRSQQMEETRARDVLGNLIDENGFDKMLFQYYPLDCVIHISEIITLSPLQLRAIAWWMDNKEGIC
jgi:hypothetical protein